MVKSVLHPGWKTTTYTTGQKSLTEMEYQKLLSSCDNLQDRLLLMLGVSLGLRREDIVRVRISNIDLQNKWLTYLEKKKGDKIRRVPMGDKLKQEIEVYINTTKPKDFLFPNRQIGKTQHMSGRTAYNRLKWLCEKSGVEPRPFHALRSTCIKLKQKQGWSVEQVAALIGDTVATVQSHYSTPSDDEMKNIMQDKEGI
jgi:integrase/recombinase XerD